MIKIPREIVYFPSGNERCEAWLYTPINSVASDPPPIIVMAHGLGAIKEFRLDAFAEKFCSAGYACLVFDYRYFGGSTGKPRQLLDIKSQLADWKAAVSFAKNIQGIDSNRVVVWGTSFGGGHALITAAEHPEIMAAIIQCPFTDGFASTLSISLTTNSKIAFMAIRDMIAKKLKLNPTRVKVAGNPGEIALMTSKDSMLGYHALINAVSHMEINDFADKNYVPARIALDIPFHRPGLRAKDVQCPILFCVCENDSVAPAKPTLKYAQTAPKGEVKVYADGHFEIYLGQPFEIVVADQLEFLSRHVALAES